MSDERFFLKMVEISEVIGTIRECQKETNKKLDEVVTQTKMTNGRVLKLEALTQNHEVRLKDFEELKQTFSEHAEATKELYAHLAKRKLMFNKAQRLTIEAVKSLFKQVQERANYVLALTLILIVLYALQEHFGFIEELLKLL